MFRLSDVKAHSFLGTENTLQKVLEAIYRKIKIADPLIHQQYILHVAIKTIYDTIGKDKLVPSWLAYDNIPPSFLTLIYVTEIVIES